MKWGTHSRLGLGRVTRFLYSSTRAQYFIVIIHYPSRALGGCTWLVDGDLCSCLRSRLTLGCTMTVLVGILEELLGRALSLAQGGEMCEADGRVEV